MKPLFACLALACIGLLYWAFKDQKNTNGTVEGETPAAPQRKAPLEEEIIPLGVYVPEGTGTGQSREIGKPKPQGLNSSWHPEKIGVLVSPYTDEEILAVGVVAGSRMTDSEGNEFVVPSFEDSPRKYYPVANAIDKLPGYVINPFTKETVDVRGLPPGSLIRDPKDPNEANRFRVPATE